METKHYLYNICWEPKSNVLFVHDTQCCYYLFSVQSVIRLLLLKKLKHRPKSGILYLQTVQKGVDDSDEDAFEDVPRLTSAQRPTKLRVFPLDTFLKNLHLLEVKSSRSKEEI